MGPMVSSGAEMVAASIGAATEGSTSSAMPAEATPASAPAETITTDTGDNQQEFQDGGEDLPIPDEVTPDAAEVAPASEEEVPPAAPGEDLPEGVVRGKNSAGKDGLFVTPDRWKTIYGNHQAIRQMSELAGELMTPEVFDVRNRAFIAYDRMRQDLISPDPEAKQALVDHFFTEAEQARQNGEVTGDPMVPFAETFFKQLGQRSPEADTRIRLSMAKELIEDLWKDAAVQKNQGLWNSLGHVAKRLGLPYMKHDEIETFAQGQTDPVRSLEAENVALRQQIQAREGKAQTAQFEGWFAAQKQAVTKSVYDDAVVPALADVAKEWQKFPDAYKNLVVDPLHSAVREAISKDRNFAARVGMLHQAASRATAQKRAEIGEQIKQQYINRAALAAEALRPQILKQAATLHQERNATLRARHEEGQRMRSPDGAHAPVPRSLIPNAPSTGAGEKFDAQAEYRRAQQLIGV